MATSYRIVRAAKPVEAVGQLGGHVKRGIPMPLGARTGVRMALVSALPLEPGSDQMVLTFLDRSSPVDAFDYQAGSGDNAVLVVPRAHIDLSIVKGVCPGDWRGLKVDLDLDDPMEEPTDLDVDPTGMDLEASDAWVDLVDDIGCDCSKLGGYPLWATVPVDLEHAMGKPMRFHSRITADILDLGLAEGYVLYTFVAEDGSGGCTLWQQSGGGVEKIYYHYQ